MVYLTNSTTWPPKSISEQYLPMKCACYERQMRYFLFEFSSFLLAIRFKLLCDFILLKQHHFPVMHYLDSKHKAILPQKDTRIVNCEGSYQPTFQIKQDKLGAIKRCLFRSKWNWTHSSLHPSRKLTLQYANETACHFVGFPNSLANQVTEYRTWTFFSSRQDFCWFWSYKLPENKQKRCQK